MQETSLVTLIKIRTVFFPRSSENILGREGEKSERELRGNTSPRENEEGHSRASPGGTQVNRLLFARG